VTSNYVSASLLKGPTKSLEDRMIKYEELKFKKQLGKGTGKSPSGNEFTDLRMLLD